MRNTWTIDLNALSDIHSIIVKVNIVVTGPNYSIEDQAKHRLCKTMGEILEKEIVRILTNNNFKVNLT